MIDVGGSGFGNRILAFASAAVLAASMNRVLELKWSECSLVTTCDTEKYGVRFEDLFKDFNKEGKLESVLYGIHNENNTFGMVHLEDVMCEMDLTQHNDRKHFPFFFERELYRQVDEACRVLRIRSNTFWAPYVLSKKFAGVHEEKLNKNFEYPFRYFIKKVLKPSDKILKIVRSMKESTKGKKWLSIHARGFWDYGGEDTEKLCKYAQQLVDDGTVDFIFFASESKSMIDIAKKHFPRKVLKLLEKELVIDTHKHLDSAVIRNEVSDMEMAIAEWYLIGEADFCMASTMDASTFSKTAVTRYCYIQLKLISLSAYLLYF